MSKINLQELQRDLKFCQFNNDQYCILTIFTVNPFNTSADYRHRQKHALNA